MFEIKEVKEAFVSPGGVFVDLGSGQGKGTLAAALVHDFDEVIGIEFLEGLYQKSLELKALYDDMYPKYIQEQGDDTRKVPEMKFIHGDLTLYDWSNADLVFANSTCFKWKMMQKVLETSEKMKQGTFLILTRKLPENESFELIYEKK